MTSAIPIAFDNSYAKLPDRFFARLPPTPVAAPRLLRHNAALARTLGIDAGWLAGPDGLAMLSGNQLPEAAEPLAMAYAGHQFGHFVPQLGDGRAILVGEVRGRDGMRYDLHLKGAGRTPFSRGGDGRAAIGPVLREYVVSEAMAAFGIPTTRVLAAVSTGEPVWREGPLPGAILMRVAHSHVRVGTFQYFAARRDTEALRSLADYVIARHYPEAAAAPAPYRALLDAVVARTAALVAAWMGVGFIHGVMNTDNMSVAGETIDYGPCAFMDDYHPGTVFSSIDHGGRYAYANQPRIAHWNMAQFAQTLLPLLGEDEDSSVAAAQAGIDAFPDLFAAAHLDILRRKLGLARQLDGDGELAADLLERMAEQRADFTLVFRRLSALSAAERSADGPVRALFADPAAFDGWAPKWRARLAKETAGDAERQEAMCAANPAYIPRNHRVEAALAAAAKDGDLAAFDEILEVLSAPFEERPAFVRYEDAPRPEEIVQATFCGT